jgi:hypothetical protein
MTKTCKTYQRDWIVCIDAPPPCACKSRTERERWMQTETETHCLGQAFQEQKIVRNQICYAEKKEKQSPHDLFLRGCGSSINATQLACD